MPPKPRLTVSRTKSVDEFIGAAGHFLAAREAEHNLLLGLTGAIRRTPQFFEVEPHFSVVTDSDGEVQAAALQTPPFNLVLSWIEDADLRAADALADALADEPLPGVLGPKKAAKRFVRRWAANSGRAAVVDVAERIFRLDRVIPPRRPARGTWRLAEPRDRELIAEWLVAFHDEATPGQPSIPDPLAAADRWIAALNRIGYLWEDGGEVVSMVGAGGETPNGIRIAPVYTPPERRGRGYASSLTAAASQDQLDRGRRFVFLFTDLANPTSNKIYRAIGYRAVCDVDQYRFAEVSA